MTEALLRLLEYLYTEPHVLNEISKFMSNPEVSQGTAAEKHSLMREEIHNPFEE